MFDKLRGIFAKKKRPGPEITEKQIHDALDISRSFLELSNSYLPEDFEKTLTTERLYVLVGFQFGVFAAAAQIVGLTPGATAQLFPTLLKSVNGVSIEQGRAIMDKLPDLIDSGYPPIEIGQNAFDSFYNSESDEAKAKYLREQAQTLEDFSNADR